MVDFEKWKILSDWHNLSKHLIQLNFDNSNMVTKLYTLKKTGVLDYVLVRVSAIFQALYFSVITFYWLMHQPINYEQLHVFFDNLAIQISTVLVAISISYHSLQGIHHIVSDYLTEHRVGKLALPARKFLILYSFLQATGIVICSFLLII